MFSRLRSFTRTPRPAAFEIREMLMLLALSPLVIAPGVIERRASNRLAAFVLRSRGAMREIRLAKVPPALSEVTGLTPEDLIQRVEAETIRERIRVLRGIVFPWWKRRLRIAGAAQVRSGLASGHGVILWIFPCAQSNVAVKQSAYAAGFPLAHLSRPSHPFSRQPFGVRYLNPILRRPEVRFLAERVVIDEQATIAPLRRLRALLSENRVVSITVTDAATSIEEVPFLGGTLSLPHGPIQLANSTGASLVPVFAYQARDRTHVEFGPPLARTDSANSTDEVLRAAIRWLQPLVVEHPEAWVGWRSSSFQPSADGV